jgi:hypothetical protein
MFTVAILIELKICTIPTPWWYQFGFLSLGPLEQRKEDGRSAPNSRRDATTDSGRHQKLNLEGLDLAAANEILVANRQRGASW